MKNITVSVDDDTYRLARIRAAERDTSVSALVKQYLASLAEAADAFERLANEEKELRARIKDFSAGDRLSRDKLYAREMRLSRHERPALRGQHRSEGAAQARHRRASDLWAGQRVVGASPPGILRAGDPFDPSARSAPRPCNQPDPHVAAVSNPEHHGRCHGRRARHQGASQSVVLGRGNHCGGAAPSAALNFLPKTCSTAARSQP